MHHVDDVAHRTSDLLNATYAFVSFIALTNQNIVILGFKLKSRTSTQWQLVVRYSEHLNTIGLRCIAEATTRDCKPRTGFYNPQLAMK